MSLIIKKLDWVADLQPVRHLTTPPDPADMVKCIKTLLRDEKVDVVRHDSACLGRRELAGALTNLMVRDPQGYDSLIFTERDIVQKRQWHPWDRPEVVRYKPMPAANVAQWKRVTRRTILRWKARALKSLVDELSSVQ